MQVEYAFLADAAQVSSDNKLSVLGAGIDELRAERFPATHLLIAFVVKLKLHPTECGREHHLEIELWDPDGQHVAPPMAGSFTAGRVADDPTRPVFVQMVLNLFQAQFPRPATYEFHVIVDRQHLKTVPLYVGQVLKAAGTNGA